MEWRNFKGSGVSDGKGKRKGRYRRENILFSRGQVFVHRVWKGRKRGKEGGRERNRCARGRFEGRNHLRAFGRMFERGG